MPTLVLRIQLLLLIASLAACWRSTPARVDGARSTPAEPAIEDRARPLTPSMLLETIEASYLGGLRRCYTARLKRDAGAGGKVVVTFTIDERGRLADGQATGVAKDIEACVERAMSRWAFPPPRNPDGTPTEATFRLALQLTAV
jgi:outer membrane biosynthesis protein TonB